jgi:KTSC domain
MKREHISSSMMASVGYDAHTRTLEIEFVRGGVYQYLDVPAPEHEALIAATSKGRFFQVRIQRVFACVRVDRP